MKLTRSCPTPDECSVVLNLRAENVRLRNLLRMPLSSAELKLVDKHCEWVAFGHAWNAVMKHRIAAINGDEQQAPADERK